MLGLHIENLHAKIGDKEILRGLTLSINPGEVHAIMGPNGSGKSTLSKVLAGHDKYEVTEGRVEMNNLDLLSLPVEERARAGFFLAFQYPLEIPGVSNANFLRAALQSRLEKGTTLEAVEFYKKMYAKMDLLEIDRSFTARSLNEGFSGGEKKRNEILQMLLLEPLVAVLDETDSGLDIDALKIVAKGVNAMRASFRSFLLITHYQRLLDYIKPDFVHIMAEGRIVRSGGPELALELESQGYDMVRVS